MIRPKPIEFDKSLIPAAIFDPDQEPRRERTDTSLRLTWESRPDFRPRAIVTWSQIVYGHRRNGHGTSGCYRPVWRAFVFRPEVGGWRQVPGGPWNRPGPAFAAVKQAIEGEDHENAKTRKASRKAGAQGT